MLMITVMALLTNLSFAAPDCSRAAGSLPNPALPAGTENTAIPIRHIVVLMQENHSFDNYFGALNDPRFYGKDIDGVQSDVSNVDSKGNPVKMQPESSLCVADPAHGWNSVHLDWDGGKLDGFVRTNDSKNDGARVMGYYAASDLPFYYSLANEFAVGDRYFCSALTQTFPNRFFLMAGTSFGHVKNDLPTSKSDWPQKTIFDTLDQFHVSWRYYSDTSGYLKLFQPMYLRDLDKIRKVADYEADLAAGTLPEVVFLDASYDGEDEHPDADVQVGEAWVAKRVQSLVSSSAWKDSVLFLTYDENGGFYDHVAPPEACEPDGVLPILPAGWQPGRFDHYGFRVPFVAVSPYAKHHYVSHRVYDHTSILKFIEAKYNLPALTARDANADGFSDIFDFNHPVMEVTPFPALVSDPAKACNQHAPLVLPKAPVSIVSKKTGNCLDVPTSASGAELQYSRCDDSKTDQKFLLYPDGFGTDQIQDLGTGLCLTVDWNHNVVDQVLCSRDEDQGFELDRAEGDAVQISGWHGDFCLQGGTEASRLGISACLDDGTSDFLLLPRVAVMVAGP
ncbi:MAG: alkaline phosphatase family protein [Bdellovibrionota bacterium]